MSQNVLKTRYHRFKTRKTCTCYTQQRTLYGAVAKHEQLPAHLSSTSPSRDAQTDFPASEHRFLFHTAFSPCFTVQGNHTDCGSAARTRTASVPTRRRLEPPLPHAGSGSAKLRRSRPQSPRAAALAGPHLHLGELGGGPASHLGHAKLRQFHLQIVQLLQQLLLLLPPQVSGLDLGLRAADRPSAPLPGPHRAPQPPAAFPRPPAAPQAHTAPPALIPPPHRGDSGAGPAAGDSGAAGSVPRRDGWRPGARADAGGLRRGRQGTAHHDGGTGAARGGKDGSRAGTAGGGRCQPEPTNPRPGGGRSLRAAQPPRAARWYRPRALTGEAAGQPPAPGHWGCGPAGGGSVLPPPPPALSAAGTL